MRPAGSLLSTCLPPQHLLAMVLCGSRHPATPPRSPATVRCVTTAPMLCQQPLVGWQDATLHRSWHDVTRAQTLRSNADTAS